MQFSLSFCDLIPKESYEINNYLFARVLGRWELLTAESMFVALWVINLGLAPCEFQSVRCSQRLLNKSVQMCTQQWLMLLRIR